jgi:predicted negative regulator of RcsB-dependent stress response
MLNKMGDCYLALGKIDAARESYRALINPDKNCTEAVEKLKLLEGDQKY